MLWSPTTAALPARRRARFDRHWWAVASRSEDGTRCRFARVSPDGEEGFPGACSAEVEYRVSAADANGSNGACLHTTMTATVDAACPVNLAQHTYFNLAGHDASSSEDENRRVDAKTHVLRLAASRYTPADATCVPIGVLLDVKGTPFDFTAARAIGARCPPWSARTTRGIDHNFALDGGADDGDEEGGETVSSAARASEETAESRVRRRGARARSGRVLVLECGAPGVQLYTNNF